jgi:hypothetical protein
MSTIQATNIKSAASASNNIVLDASGNATFAGTAAMASSFLRNRIINGDMRIDQRNAGASVTVNNASNNTFSVDRWQGAGETSDGVFTLQRSTVAPTGFTNSLLATVTTADASVGASQRYFIQQRIEGFNTADFGWGAAGALSVTLSFWVRSSVTGTYGGSMRNSAGDRSYPFTYSISAANTWEYKTVTVSGDTTGTWLTDNGSGVLVTWGLGVGSSLSGTAGAWSASGLWSATGATNWISTNGATFYLTGVQLEVGTAATPFERRQYGQELALCQRYFQRFSAFSGSTFDAFISYFGGTGAVSGIQMFFEQMRATPTASISNATVEYYSYAGVWTSTTLTAVIFDSQRFYFFCLTDGDGRGKLMRAASNSAANQPYASFSAEL